MGNKKTTIKDIARELNLSVGTVSKALSQKKGVKEETREMVLQSAKDLGYRVNKLAQSMARNTVVVGILIPAVFKYHYGMLELGMKKELLKLADYNIKGVFRHISGLHATDEIERAADLCIAEKIDIAIICPSFDNAYRAALEKLNKAEIPVVLLGTDIEKGKRLSCVSANSRLSGKMAGEFMRHLMEDGKRCAVLIGNKDMQEHKEKVDGFLEQYGNADGYIGAFETQDESILAYRITEKVLNDYSDLGGIYVATGNSISVCECLEQNGKAGTIKVIATDIFPKIKEKVHQGAIRGVIYQNQIQQGVEAIRNVFEYMSGGHAVKDIAVMPQLVLRSNIDHYSDYMDEQVQRVGVETFGNDELPVIKT